MPIYACGLIMGYNPETKVWEPISNLKFDVRITLPDDKMQLTKMYIEFNLGKTESWIWLFPVPVTNVDIPVDLVNSFDYPYNYYVLSDEMSTFYRILVSLYTGSHAHFVSVNDILEMKEEFSPQNKRSYRLLVEKKSPTTTSKLALETCTFSADKKEEFFKYIEDKNYTLSESEKEVIQEYFTKNFSIVFNYFYIKKPELSDAMVGLSEERKKLLDMPGMEIFSDVIQKEERKRELEIEKEALTPHPDKICLNAFYTINSMPSKQIFFPQKLLNLYSGEKIPVNIYIDNVVKVMNDKNKKMMYYTYNFRIDNQLVNFKLLQIRDVPRIVSAPKRQLLSLKRKIEKLYGDRASDSIKKNTFKGMDNDTGDKNTSVQESLEKYVSQPIFKAISYMNYSIDPKEVKDDLWLKTDTLTMKVLFYFISPLYTIPSVVLLYFHIIFYAIVTMIMSIIAGMICFKDKTRPWKITLIVLGFLYGIHVLLFCIVIFLIYLYRRLTIPKEIRNIAKEHPVKIRIPGFSLYFLTMFLFNAVYSFAVVTFFKVIMNI